VTLNKEMLQGHFTSIANICLHFESRNRWVCLSLNTQFSANRLL